MSTDHTRILGVDVRIGKRLNKRRIATSTRGAGYKHAMLIVDHNVRLGFARRERCLTARRGEQGPHSNGEGIFANVVVDRVVCIELNFGKHGRGCKKQRRAGRSR